MAMEILKPPRAAILKVEGINCDAETQFAFEKAGARADIVHLNELRFHEKKVQDYQILCIPGGFSYGDDVGSGRVLAIQLQRYLADELMEHVSKGRLTLGICNGFQVLVQTGLLPFGEVKSLHKIDASLSPNALGKFEGRWVYLKPEQSACQFIPEAGHVELPVAHGEGRFFTDAQTLDSMEQSDLVTFRYCTAMGDPTQAYPDNPNGSLHAIAGICDPEGKIIGLMPHPERYVDPMQHPTKRNDGTPYGLQFFQRMVNFAKDL